MKPARLDDLIQRYIDARLSEAERAELEAELLASPAARRVFWRHLQFEGVLQEHIDAQEVRRWMTDGERAGIAHERSLSVRSEPARRGGNWVPWIAAAAALFVAALFWLAPGPDRRETTSDGVAVLAGAADVRWSGGQKPWEPGAILPRGRLRIDSGLLGLEFYSGAVVTVEGPADIELTGVDQIYCRQGRIRAQVSNRAHGFRVHSPHLDLVDLGTEFGVDIGREGQTELHVFSGKVEIAAVRASGPGRAKPHLGSGEGLRIDQAGVSPIAARPAGFAGRVELATRLQEQTRTRYAAWRESAAANRNDPRLVLHYDFEPATRLDRSLPNRGGTAGGVLDGTVVGAAWAEGRWPGKTALEFREPSDRVRIFVPGEFNTLTLVAWLRVDSFDTLFSGILLTDGFVKGSVHWQFYNGKLRLGIGGDRNSRGRIGTEYDVESVDPGAWLGRWRQVAAVIDMEKREVVHYLDGRPIKREPISRPHPVALGKCELGNWGLPDGTGSPPVRNFHGRMDEFMLFNQALTDAEIAALFEQGRPWPGPVAAALR
jgi:hypothetical protein